jgi:hypothetical protein
VKCSARSMCSVVCGVHRMQIYNHTCIIMCAYTYTIHERTCLGVVFAAGVVVLDALSGVVDTAQCVISKISNQEIAYYSFVALHTTHYT